VLPKWCTVSVPWSNDQVDVGFSIVASDPRSKSRPCGVDLTTCPRTATSPKVFKIRRSARLAAHATSRRHDCFVDTMPLGAANAVSLPPLWASRLRTLRRWRRQYTWGSCDRATRSFSPTQSRRFVRLSFYQSSATLLNASAQSAAIRCGFDRGFATARQRS
jgi:hypothetical protein